MSLLSDFFLSEASFVASDFSLSDLSSSALLSLSDSSTWSALLPSSPLFFVGATTGVGALSSDVLFLTLETLDSLSASSTSASLSTFSELSAVVSSLESDSSSASLSVSTLEAFPSPESFESSDVLLSSASEAPPEPA